jgi:hypothetical protein
MPKLKPFADELNSSRDLCKTLRSKRFENTWRATAGMTFYEAFWMKNFRAMPRP